VLEMNREILAAVLSGLLLSGCVSMSAFRKAQADAAQCQSEKTTLQQQMDTLNLDKETLSKTAAEKDAEIAKLRGTYDQLVGSLKNEIANGQIQVTQLKDKLTVNLVEKILFDSGKAQIKPSGMEVLHRIGDVLKGVQDKDIRIEGHTDNVPVGPRLRERYPTNWELSTARATNVVRYLHETAGVDPTRLIAAGAGEYHPVASNDTPEGQADNRRIDIVLVPSTQPAAGQPPAAKPAEKPANNP
jgi:chemotaxis protein MotB